MLRAIRVIVPGMNDDRRFNLLVLLGATASGKTGLAVALARKFDGEILSADSRQVYRGMDIGTGKDLREYGDIPYHLIDVAEPAEEYNVFRFQGDFFTAFEAVSERGKLPVAVGGTGFYLESILSGRRLIPVPENPLLREELAALDQGDLVKRLLAARPDQHNTTDLEERERLIRAIEIAEGEAALQAAAPPLPMINPLILGLRWQRETLYQRIEKRLDERLEEGLIGEVQRLRDEGVADERLARFGLEYRFVLEFLRGKRGRTAMVRDLKQAIRKFAKRQETWFRRMEKKGTEIYWLDASADPMAKALRIIKKLNSSPSSTSR